jgi:hypothetical protein
MSYISGHYRGGHFRNGKWVSGGYVKGHYRSGLGYSLYPLNTTATNVTEKCAHPNDIVLEELLSPQNVKIISGMMENIDNYPHARTLRFFEAYYPYDVEDVHYSEVLMLMNVCSSIDELISVREFVKGKISKISQSSIEKIPDDISKELSECISKVLSWNIICFHRLKRNLRADVNSCYDENIFRLFKECKTITEDFCGECFINLSFCSKYSKYKDLISHEAKERAGLHVSELLETIAKRYEDFRKHWHEYKEFKEEMNGYNEAKQTVEEDFEYLKQFNWRLLPWQKSYYSEIDREEIKKREDTKNLQNERRTEREQKIKKVEIIQQKEELKKERNSTVIKIVIGVIICVPLVILLVQIPSQVWNWIIAILIILALLK